MPRTLQILTFPSLNCWFNGYKQLYLTVGLLSSIFLSFSFTLEYLLLFTMLPFLFDSWVPLVSLCLQVIHSISFHCCTLDVFSPLSLLFDFLMQDLSLNGFQSRSLSFSLFPFASFFLTFSCCHSFLPFFRSVCSCSAETGRSPRTEKCGCLWTRMRESVHVSLTLPLCWFLPLECQWQSEFI